MNTGINEAQISAVICKALNCEEKDINHIERIESGMTNRSFCFKVKDKKYILRVPGEGASDMIDRNNEAIVYETIRGLGFCDDPVYFDPVTGYKIAYYIDGVRSCDPHNEDDVRQCMKKLKSFHEYLKDGKPLTVPHKFDIYERIDFYDSLWIGKSINKDYETVKENCLSLKNYIDKHKLPFQLCHIDSVADNFLFDSKNNVQLTDWEYAGMQDRHVDIAMFCIYSLYNKEEVDKLIDIYFEGECDKQTRIKIYCYIAICGLLWSNWSEYKYYLGIKFGEYGKRQYQYAKDYYEYAKENLR